MLVHGNIERGSDIGFGGMDDGTIVRFNTFIDNDTALDLGITDPSAYTQGNMTLHNNTIVHPHRAMHVGGGYGSNGGTSVTANVFVMDEVLGTGESDPLMAIVHPYVDSADPNLFDFDRNCYHAPSPDAGFRFGTGVGGSFATWQGNGFDASSVWDDPMFTSSGEESYAVGSTSNCAALEGVGAW